MKNFKFILEKVLIYYFLLKYNSFDSFLKNLLVKNLFIKFFLKKNFVVKFGLDLTSPKLHLGHFSILKFINNYKNIVNFVIIMGIKTALLIDPTYKYTIKRKNFKKNYIFFFIKQFKLIFKKKKNIKLYFNSEWLDLLSNNDLLKIYNKLNILKILKRNDFKKKIIRNLKIQFSEIIYIIFQSEDSIFLKSNLELGGYDQKLNFIINNYIKKNLGKFKQSYLLFPLIIINNKKLSKSKNCLSLNDNLINRNNLNFKEMKIYIKILLNKIFNFKYINKIYTKNYLITNFIKFFINFYFNVNFLKKNKIKFKNLIKLKILYKYYKFKYIIINNIIIHNFNYLFLKNNYNCNIYILNTF